LWVDQGCEAKFEILSRRNERTTRGTLRCSSENYAYKHCQTDTRGGARLLKQRSKVRCTEHETWGYDRRGVWVDQGCSAEFQLGNTVQNPIGNALEQTLDNLLTPPR
jgi:hypothetical protein